MEKFDIICLSNHFGGLLKMARRRRVVMNGSTAKGSIIAGIVFILIAIIMAGSMAYEISYAQKAMSEGVSVSAVCTKRWSETKTTSHKSKTHTTTTTKHTYYYANADYTYNGQKYNCSKLSVDSGTRVGDIITLYILPENPGKYIQPGKTTFSISLSIMCLVFFSMGASAVSRGVAYRKRVQRGGYTVGISQPANNIYQSNNGGMTAYNGLANQYSPNNTYQGYNDYNPNSTYQGYNDTPNNTYQSYNDNNRR